MEFYSTQMEKSFIDHMYRIRVGLRKRGTKFDPPEVDELTLLKRYRRNQIEQRKDWGTVNKREVLVYLAEKIETMEMIQEGIITAAV